MLYDTSLTTNHGAVFVNLSFLFFAGVLVVWFLIEQYNKRYTSIERNKKMILETIIQASLEDKSLEELEALYDWYWKQEHESK